VKIYRSFWDAMAAGRSKRWWRHKTVSGRAVGWLWLSIAAALFAMMGSGVGLFVEQNLRSPHFGVPAIGIGAGRRQFGAGVAGGHDPSGDDHACPLCTHLLWLGVLTFTIHNYGICTFSVPFGSLSFLWVAVLGLCTHALVGGIAATDRAAVAARFASRCVILAAESEVVAVARLKPGQSCRRAALADCRGGAE